MYVETQRPFCQRIRLCELNNGDRPKKDSCLLTFEQVCLPIIEVQPSDVTISTGEIATLTVVTSGRRLCYQWFGPGGNALTDVDGDIKGSNTSNLQIINVESGDAGDYTVVVTNSAGSVVSDAATLSIGERLKHAYFSGSSAIIFLLVLACVIIRVVFGRI